MTENKLTEAIIGAAIDVHRVMGPGLLEGIYEECMCVELERRGLEYSRQKPVDVIYRNRRVAAHLRIDLLVEDLVVVELKAIEVVLPIHGAQLLTYLRLTGVRLGLLINFNVPQLTTGIKRVVNGYPAVELPQWSDSPAVAHPRHATGPLSDNRAQ